MKPIAKLFMAFLTPLLVVGWVLSAQAAESNIYTMNGRISAINLNAGTVVVQVPVKNNQLLTVAGPVVQNASLKKDGKKADLNAFKVGDQVQVTWQKTARTLLIKRLAAR